MSYFVTGATGFIGRYLVRALLQRGRSTVYVLVRGRSLGKLDELQASSGAKDAARRVIPVIGDLAQAEARRRQGRICASSRARSTTSSTSPRSTTSRPAPRRSSRANIDGTAHALEFAHAVDAGCFHHVSSIAAAGLYEGVFREDMFEEAEDLDHPYFTTKHESEAIVRAECKRAVAASTAPAWSSAHSQTGEIDKIDGPYYFFKLIQKLREILPPWMPTVGIEGGRINIVPVDFVVDALDHIAHRRASDGQCFHLTDPRAACASAKCSTSSRAPRTRRDDDAHRRRSCSVHARAACSTALGARAGAERRRRRC